MKQLAQQEIVLVLTQEPSGHRRLMIARRGGRSAGGTSTGQIVLRRLRGDPQTAQGWL
jgi:hypothetical protein